MLSLFRKKFKRPPQNLIPYILQGNYGIYYQIHPNSALDYHIVKNGIIQDWIALNLMHFVDKDGIVFDVGSNVGLLSLPFAKLHVPNGHVFSFEADMENFQHLQKNISLNSLTNISSKNICIQDNPSVKTTTFFKRRAIDGDKLENNGLSTMEKMPNHIISENSVSCSTIDLIVDEEDLSCLDFVKIDVEGSENKVLKGAKKTIQNFKPIILYEYSLTIDNLLNSNNTLQCYSMLQELGYKQFDIYQEKYLKPLETYDATIESTNVLAFHESKIPKNLSQFL